MIPTINAILLGSQEKEEAINKTAAKSMGKFSLWLCYSQLINTINIPRMAQMLQEICSCRLVIVNHYNSDEAGWLLSDSYLKYVS